MKASRTSRAGAAQSTATALGVARPTGKARVGARLHPDRHMDVRGAPRRIMSLFGKMKKAR